MHTYKQGDNVHVYGKAGVILRVLENNLYFVSLTTGLKLVSGNAIELMAVYEEKRYG